MQQEILYGNTRIGNCKIGEEDNRRETLKNEIEEGLEYVLYTIASNERITLPLIKYITGSVYGGEWKNGRRDGQGRQMWPNGSVYEGEWVEDKSSGKVWQYIYERENKHMQMEIFTMENGKMIKQMEKELKYTDIKQWENEQWHGKGVEYWPDGAKYQGEYYEGQKHGKGILNYPNGSKYEGQFLQNEFHGYGTYVRPGQRVYKGEWKKNKFHGKGQLIWQDGRKYTGEYEEDKNMEKVFLNGQMEENISELGFKEDNMEQEFIIYKIKK